MATADTAENHAAEKEQDMRKLAILPIAALLAGGLTLGACNGDRAVRGAAIGAAGGAAVGAVVPGVSAVEGAAAGAAAGAVVGATTDDNRGDTYRSDRYCADRYPRGSSAYDRCRRGD